jgi:hypothetical protein
MLSAEPRLRKSNTATDDPNRAVATTLSDEPNEANPRSDKELPK